MARRGNKHLLHELASLPWWVSLVVAGIVFVAVRWLLPVVGSSNRVLRPLGEALHDKAWWFALPFVVVAGIAAFNSYYRRRLLDDQVGLETLRALSWQDFERLVGEAYRRQGYVLEEVGGSAPDGGIDLLLHRRGQKVVVQCKRWKSSQVGVSLIREFYGVIAAEKAGRGIFVTTGTFTPDAVEFASGKPLELVDGHALAKLVEGVQPPKPKQQVTSTTPACPKCGGDGATGREARGERREGVLGMSTVSAVSGGPKCRVRVVPQSGVASTGCRLRSSGIPRSCSAFREHRSDSQRATRSNGSHHRRMTLGSTAMVRRCVKRHRQAEAAIAEGVLAGAGSRLGRDWHRGREIDLCRGEGAHPGDGVDGDQGLAGFTKADQTELGAG